VVLGASARGREWGESSACKDVADGLEWVIENCSQCQGKFEDFLYVKVFLFVTLSIVDNQKLTFRIGANAAGGNGNFIVLVV
jgi:hypothetical protein